MQRVGTQVADHLHAFARHVRTGLCRNDDIIAVGHDISAILAPGLFGRRHAVRDRLHLAVRSLLTDVLSCRENRSDSGVVARVVGDVIAADNFLANMGTEDFLSCLSRQALEAACADTSVLPRQKVKDTRAALVEHFKEGSFVHPSALFAPAPEKLTSWLKKNEAREQPEDDGTPEDRDELDGDAIVEPVHNDVGEDPAPQEEDLTDEPIEAYKVAAE